MFGGLILPSFVGRRKPVCWAPTLAAAVAAESLTYEHARAVALHWNKRLNSQYPLSGLAALRKIPAAMAQAKGTRTLSQIRPGAELSKRGSGALSGARAAGVTFFVVTVSAWRPEGRLRSRALTLFKTFCRERVFLNCAKTRLFSQASPRSEPPYAPPRAWSYSRAESDDTRKFPAPGESMPCRPQPAR